MFEGHGDAKLVLADKAVDIFAEPIVERAVEIMRVEVTGNRGDVPLMLILKVPEGDLNPHGTKSRQILSLRSMPVSESV